MALIIGLTEPPGKQVLQKKYSIHYTEQLLKPSQNNKVRKFF